MEECINVNLHILGGCEIGSRPINFHLDAFRQLGIYVDEKEGYINCECTKITGTEIVLDFPSVGATENIMLASVLGDGVTYVKNVAREPEIRNLQEFLNSMGACVSGAGSNTIVIKGVTSLHDSKVEVIPDRIETGTYLCMAVATKGELELRNANPEHVASILHKLKQVNCKIGYDKHAIYIKSPKEIKAINIKTMPYPGFPTDMQSQFITLLSIAKGTSIVVESIFENRFKYINELNKMGTNIVVEGHTAIIQGVETLNFAKVEAKELRGGAALITAGLIAKGRTEVLGVEYIERGYENLIEKLTFVGAKIEKQW